MLFIHMVAKKIALTVHGFKCLTIRFLKCTSAYDNKNVKFVSKSDTPRTAKSIVYAGTFFPR